MAVVAPRGGSRVVIKYTRLRLERERRGISQEDMAGMLGYTKNAYSLKERGLRRFFLEEAILIADRLGYSVDELFCTEPTEAREPRRKRSREAMI